MNRYDAIVVGARAAGSPTAMLLARKGYRVLLVDRATFPSDALSTHLIHGQGMARLARWGLATEAAVTDAPPIHVYRFDFGPFAIVGRPRLPDAGPAARAPRRLMLDKLLVDAAGAAGAEVREQFVVDGLVVEDGVVTGISGRSEGGSRVFEHARVVIGADGANSIVARSVAAPKHVARPPLEALYYAYWSDLPTDNEFQLYARDRRGFAMVPTNDGLTIALVAWPVDEFEANRSDLLGNYLRAFDAEPSLAQRIRRATRQSRPRGLAMENYYRQSWGPGWALVGDAAYHKDAVTAQGISDAFRDADSLSVALDAVLAGRRRLEDALAEVQSERESLTMPMFELTCQLASMEPPEDQIASLFAAIASSQAASDDFATMFAGSMPVDRFFDPANLERILTPALA